MKYYIRDRIKAILKLDEPPHKLALAFALGVFVAFTPTIGLHLVTCFLLAWAFRVSKFVVITASLINNPWTMVPLYGFCIWLGLKITGNDGAAPSIAWGDLSLTNFYGVLRPYIWPFVAGTLVVGVFAAVLSYFLFYYIALRYKGRRQGR